MALKREKPKSVPSVGAGELWKDEDFAQAYPDLYAFLHDYKYDDGTERATGTMTVFVKAGTLRLSLSDKDRGTVAYVTAGAFDELLTLADKAICDDCTEWVSYGPKSNGQKPPF